MSRQLPPTGDVVLKAQVLEVLKGQVSAGPTGQKRIKEGFTGLRVVLEGGCEATVPYDEIQGRNGQERFRNCQDLEQVLALSTEPTYIDVAIIKVKGNPEFVIYRQRKAAEKALQGVVPTAQMPQAQEEMAVEVTCDSALSNADDGNSVLSQEVQGADEEGGITVLVEDQILEQVVDTPVQQEEEERPPQQFLYTVSQIRAAELMRAQQEQASWQALEDSSANGTVLVGKVQSILMPKLENGNAYPALFISLGGHQGLFHPSQAPVGGQVQDVPVDENCGVFDSQMDFFTGLMEEFEQQGAGEVKVPVVVYSLDAEKGRARLRHALRQEELDREQTHGAALSCVVVESIDGGRDGQYIMGLSANGHTVRLHSRNVYDPEGRLTQSQYFWQLMPGERFNAVTLSSPRIAKAEPFGMLRRQALGWEVTMATDAAKQTKPSTPAGAVRVPARFQPQKGKPSRPVHQPQVRQSQSQNGDGTLPALTLGGTRPQPQSQTEAPKPKVAPTIKPEDLKLGSLVRGSYSRTEGTPPDEEFVYELVDEYEGLEARLPIAKKGKLDLRNLRGVKTPTRFHVEQVENGVIWLTREGV